MLALELQGPVSTPTPEPAIPQQSDTTRPSLQLTAHRPPPQPYRPPDPPAPPGCSSLINRKTNHSESCDPTCAPVRPAVSDRRDGTGTNTLERDTVDQDFLSFDRAGATVQVLNAGQNPDQYVVCTGVFCPPRPGNGSPGGPVLDMIALLCSGQRHPLKGPDFNPTPGGHRHPHIGALNCKFSSYWLVSEPSVPPPLTSVSARRWLDGVLQQS
ncbi:unnamed protein product [Gadus morhua 'NCC']